MKLLSGIAAEKVLCDSAPLDGSSQDLKEARAFAIIVCLPGSIDAFLEYARQEAEALIAANRNVVLAIAAALVERGTLTGDQVDRIIAIAVAREALAAEKVRRADWARIRSNAAVLNNVAI